MCQLMRVNQSLARAFTDKKIKCFLPQQQLKAYVDEVEYTGIKLSYTKSKAQRTTQDMCASGTHFRIGKG